MLTDDSYRAEQERRAAQLNRDRQTLLDELRAEPLGDKFWSARPFLDHVRQAARARRVAPAALLGAVLARASAYVPPSTCVPAIVGGTVPLSLYVALISPTGVGKSTPLAVASELLPSASEWVRSLSLGSGEGVADAYLRARLKGASEREQGYHGVLFDLDEGRVLAEMADRKGATLPGVLCTAWVGGGLGQANADPARFRNLRPGTYSLGLVSAWQPGKAASLIVDEADTGLAGRFLYVPTDDRSAPDRRPGWPGPWSWRPPPMRRSGDVVVPTPLEYDESIRSEVDQRRVCALRGELIPAALDAHRDLLCLKVAGLLAVLGGREDVDVGDWSLATTLAEASDRVRERVIEQYHLTARRRAEAKRHEAAELAGEVDGRAQQRALDAVVRAIGRKAHREPEPPNGFTAWELWKAAAGRDRLLVTQDEAIERAEIDGYISAFRVGSETRYRRGRNQPA